MVAVFSGFQFYRLDDFKCMYIWNRRSILKSIYPYGNGSFLSEFKQRFFRKLQFGWNDVKGKNLSLNSYKNVKNLRMDFNWKRDVLKCTVLWSRKNILAHFFVQDSVAEDESEKLEVIKWNRWNIKNRYSSLQQSLHWSYSQWSRFISWKPTHTIHSKR